MKIYEFQTRGKALGAIVRVMARRIDVALRIAERWCDEKGLDKTGLRLTSKTTAECPMIVYEWDGDY